MESIREATLTALPQMSYCGFLAPITPATTGPMLMPKFTSLQLHTVPFDSIYNIVIEISSGPKLVQPDGHKYFKEFINSEIFIKIIKKINSALPFCLH